MKAQIARREFLKRISRDLGCLGVGSVVFDSVVSQLFARAFAQTLNPNAVSLANYYVHFTLLRAPPRWTFDLPLKPSGTESFTSGSFGTLVEKVGGQYQPTYVADAHNLSGGRKIHLPPVWKYNLRSGPAFSSLLENTAFIRGVDMEVDNHQISNARQVAPNIGNYSLNGVVSDLSDLPIATIADTSSEAASAFRSKKGFGATAIVYSSNPVATLLRPFANFFGTRVVHGPAAAALTAAAFAEFEQYAVDRGIASSALPEAYDKAMDLIEEGKIVKLGDQWANVYAGYENAVSEAMRDVSGLGIFAAPITGSAEGRFQYANGLFVQADLRTMFGATSSVARLAQNFAVADILLGKATPSLVLTLPYPTELDVGGTKVTISHDQHYVGSVVSTVVTTVYYRAVLACLARFRASLITKQIFNKTVIHISSEFNRSPRKDHSGSDHAPKASNATLISGMIQKNIVVGNIKHTASDAKYPGTFGEAANYKNWTRKIQVNDIAWTISAMLNADVVVTNGYVLLKKQGTSWVRPVDAETKNV